jgi:uncharacterized protein YecT (DUF1311 family)
MKQFLRAVLCTSAVVICAAPVCAARRPPAARQDEQDEQDNPCPDACNQQELNRCASQAFQKADAELNKLYQQLMRDAGAAERAKLRAAQLA